GKEVEKYVYDPAGNILSKTVAGKTTTYTYDKANQLVSSKTADGKVTKYEYDAAGRMVKEGEKTFAYGWLDKVMQVAENGKTTQSYSYDISGQLAIADYGDSKETFLWDGLALLSRNNLKYVNEPAVTGGNPILAGDKMLFDDMLGNTLGVKDGEKFSAIDRDAFGELKPGEKPNLAVNFFTGKPEIDGLGYSFLFRNYRADLGKWLSADPISFVVNQPNNLDENLNKGYAQLGYPDGWNNLAYASNKILSRVDRLGLCDHANCTSDESLSEAQRADAYLFTLSASCGSIESHAGGIVYITLSNDRTKEAFGGKSVISYAYPKINLDLRDHPEPHLGSAENKYYVAVQYYISTITYSCGEVVTKGVNGSTWLYTKQVRGCVHE
ncbi:RHS repeat domain-containing protein, partial [Victivallis vadensis]|uniref:RHS repeat domain-containing protein n=1 Tax=Victivallis vadensis TaxID=172901 RepID=UPI0023F26B54